MSTKKKLGPFSTGDALGGLPGAGALSDYMGQTDERSVRPTTAELFGTPKGKKPVQASLPKTPSRQTPLSPRFQEDRRELEKIITIPLPSRQFIITARLLTNTPVRIDTGVTNRADVAIWNVSTVVVWVNTSASVAANAGIPLGPSALGAYNGGAFSADLSEEVKFWGVASAAGAHLIIVMEAAK